MVPNSYPPLVLSTVDLHPHIRKVLRSLRLTRVLTGVFLRATELTLKRLLVVEPFVTYG
jgi:large subunit ribosomal protein L7e